MTDGPDPVWRGRRSGLPGYDFAHALAREVAQAQVPMGFGEVVDGQVAQLGRQEVGADDGGESFGRALSVLVLTSGQCAEGFRERFGRGGGRGRRCAARGCDRFPDRVGHVVEGGPGEPVQFETEVSREREALTEAGDHGGPVSSGTGGQVVADRVEGALACLLPVLG